MVVELRLNEIIRAAVGRCDAFTGDKSQLAAARINLDQPGVSTASARELEDAEAHGA